jgi:glycosyltransferase involved in cell wall biosynthesis
MMASFVFWGSVALVFYTYAGYACVLALLAMFRDRAVRRASITPPVSFIITAYNEERRLREKIENTLRQVYPASRLEIIIASDASTDGTDATARAFADRVRLVRAPVRRGKEVAQQLAVEAASGEILIFSDVATALAPDGVSGIVANFADETVGCVSSVDRFVDAGGRPSGEGAYVRYEMFLRALETRANTLVGLSGSFFAARRDVCRNWAADRQSDFSTLLNAVDLGLRGVLDSRTAGYYRNIVDGRESERKQRTVVRGIAVLARNARMLNPFRYGLFAWQLASHKLCRWLVPFAMIGAAAANAALASRSAFYQLTLCAQVAFYAAAVAGVWTAGTQALRIPAFLLSSNAAILIAWLRFASGERITCWDPSERLTSLPQTGSR